ncbi:MAG: hypothetical protein HEQ35_31115 [Gloeotrichia echinulata IR180]|nr:gamma-glutamyltransferase family protein [Gloeotrichia echinulata DEX184]
MGFYTPGYESPETSHLTVVDEQRNAISLTILPTASKPLNSIYGG